VLTALVIFIITYVFIGLRQIPWVHIDRPAGALVGAVLMVVFGVLTLEETWGRWKLGDVGNLGTLIPNAH